MFVQGKLTDLSAVRQRSRGLWAKLCRWCPVHLPVMALFGVRQVAVGLNTTPKHRHLPRGLLVRALSLLLGVGGVETKP